MIMILPRTRYLTRPLFVATLAVSLESTCAFKTTTSRHFSTPTRPSFRLLSMKSNEQSPLIDVDCNLLHPDLISVMHSLSTLTLDESNTVPGPLQILHHPSTTQANIVAMVSPSSTLEESEASINLLQSTSKQERNHISIKTTVGVHPYHCRTSPTLPDLKRLRALLERPTSKQFIGSIGETGLDYSQGFPQKEHQLSWFRSHLDLAMEYNLPIFLHERLAFDDTLQCIDEAVQRHQGKHPMPDIIVHCFTGTLDECVEYMKRGYYISVSGYILKAGEENCEQVRTCLREGMIPLDRLMIETDAPYMGFAGNKETFFEVEGESFNSLPSKAKKKRLKSIYPNVPCVLPLVLRDVWEEINCGREERGESTVSLDELAAISTENARKFFGL